jgi:anti-sigma factor RsiW
VTCQEVADYLADYVNGELTDRERALFEEHLHLCPNCVEYLAIYRTTVTLGRHAFDDSDAVERRIPEGLVAAILAARKGRACHMR